MPQNPLIANTFFRSGQIEAWGRGIEKMRNGCIADNLPEPEFDIMPNIFIIRFNIRNNNQMIGNASNTNGGVNEIKKQIVDLMKKNPEISAEQIANSLNTTKRRVEYNISRLKEMGLIERIGADKNGHWVVKT